MSEPELKVNVTADTSGLVERLKMVGDTLSKAASEILMIDADAELDAIEALPEEELAMVLADLANLEAETEGETEDFEKAEMASKGRSWDAGAARKAIKAWATGSDGKVNVAKYAQAFLYKGCKQTGKLGDCKFPVKTVVGGKLVTVPRAVAAAKARFNQSKGIGSGAKATMRSKLNAASGKISGYKPFKKSDLAEEHQFDLFAAKGPDKKQLVYGIVYKPYEIDTQNQWTTPEVLEDAAHWFMENSQLVDTEHRALADAKVLESYIAKSSFDLDGRNVPQGSWVTAFRLSDELMRGVEGGDYNGLSMAGKQVALYGSTPPEYEVQDENEALSIAELIRIRPTTVGLVNKAANREKFIIARCDGSDCPKKQGETAMEKSDKGVEETGATSEPTTNIPEEYRAYVEEQLAKSAEENEALKKQVEEAMEKAAKLEDERKTQEFMAKAESFDHMPTDGLGELLKEANDKLEPDSYKKLEELLRANNEALAKSAAFKEVGSNAIPPDSVDGRIKAAAAEIMAKSDKPITEAAAELAALKADPQLYAEYREKKRSG